MNTADHFRTRAHKDTVNFGRAVERDSRNTAPAAHSPRLLVRAPALRLALRRAHVCAYRESR
ncbi:hypothetical protein [Actinophytocola sp.]|uniref:hypothetical protein n=1 Tax=Actinophytocola sp. TaxID=1872138 RepID=UPI002ED491B0